MRIGNIWTPCSITSIPPSGGCEHARGTCGAAPHAQRDRVLQLLRRPADPRFPTRTIGPPAPSSWWIASPTARRPRRHGGVSAAPRVQHPPRALHGGQGGACRAGRQQADGAVFTGLSGSGKSTIANIVEQAARRAADLQPGRRQYPPRAVPRPRLHRRRPRGASAASARWPAVRRWRHDRARFLHLALPGGATRMVRDLLAEGEFVEVFVDTPIEDCIKRDPKGLYRAGRGDQELHRHRQPL